MKTGIGLALIAVGAILAFAVKGSPSWLDIHTAGWVIMIVGLLGLVLPRRTYDWIGRRMQVRRTYTRNQQAPVSYTARTPGAQRIEAGVAPRQTLVTEVDPDGVPYDEPVQPHYRPAQSTEVIEDRYEEP
jgi:hypothetical protein